MKTILLATADRGLAVEISDLLSNFGYRAHRTVTTTADALAAIDELASIGCVIVDTKLHCPGQRYADGFRLIEAIRQRPNLAKLPVFGVLQGSPPDTAETLMANVKLLQSLGATDILYRPIRGDVLLGKVIFHADPDFGTGGT